MGFFAWIFVGLIAGWLAEQIAGREHGLVTNFVVGVIGAVIGGLLFVRCSASTTTKVSTLRPSPRRRAVQSSYCGLLVPCEPAARHLK